MFRKIDISYFQRIQFLTHSISSVNVSQTFGGGDTVSFGVEQSANLRQIAVEISDVLDRARFHKIRVISF